MAFSDAAYVKSPYGIVDADIEGLPVQIIIEGTKLGVPGPVIGGGARLVVLRSYYLETLWRAARSRDAALRSYRLLYSLAYINFELGVVHEKAEDYDRARLYYKRAVEMLLGRLPVKQFDFDRVTTFLVEFWILVFARGDVGMQIAFDLENRYVPSPHPYSPQIVGTGLGVSAASLGEATEPEAMKLIVIVHRSLALLLSASPRLGISEDLSYPLLWQVKGAVTRMLRLRQSYVSTTEATDSEVKRLRTAWLDGGLSWENSSGRKLTSIRGHADVRSSASPRRYSTLSES